MGKKTSLRILNSQILSKPRFYFVNSSLYHNISLVVWDPSAHNSSLEQVNCFVFSFKILNYYPITFIFVIFLLQWAQNPDFPFLNTFFSRRKSSVDEDLHLLDPRGLWDLWDYLSLHSPLPIPANPPSSGFIGKEIVGRNFLIFDFLKT